jgi:hypothetical protein
LGKGKKVRGEDYKYKYIQTSKETTTSAAELVKHIRDYTPNQDPCYELEKYFKPSSHATCQFSLMKSQQIHPKIVKKTYLDPFIKSA